MILEKSRIQLKALQTEKSGEDYLITETGASGRSSSKLKISATQFLFLEKLIQGQSIFQIVEFFLAQNKIVSFIELFNMLQEMNNRHWIMGPWGQLLNAHQEIEKAKVAALNAKDVTSAKAKLKSETFLKIEKTLAFMRYMGPDLKNLFSERARIYNVNRNSIICRAGDQNRDLYVMMDGYAGVYRNSSKVPNQKELVGTLAPGAVFGERAFFMNVPRTADVVTMDASQVAVFPFSEDIEATFSSQLSAELLLRLQAIQGILASPIFSKIPGEGIESLAFAGKIFSVEPGQTIVHEDETGKSFILIIQGSFVVTQKSKPIRHLSKGDTLGEVALLVTGGVRTATVTAQSKSTILEIGIQEFYNLLSLNLVMAKEIEALAWKRWENDKARKS